MWTLALALALSMAPPVAPPERSTAELILALPACESLECDAAKALLERKATPELRSALSHLNELVRFWATGLLGELRDREAVEPLATCAGFTLKGDAISPPPEASVRVRAGALYALGQLGDLRATPVLTAALRHKDVNLRIGATLGLGLLRDPASADALLGALSDKDDEVRGFSAAALGDLGEVRAVAPLALRLREDVKPGVRALAAGALGLLAGGSPPQTTALDALLAALEQDEDPEVRVECVRALTGNAGARTALEKAKGQPDPVGAAARAALEAR